LYLEALDYLFSQFKKGDVVLDLGCGTGLEAIPLALKVEESQSHKILNKEL
jgi:ubiquinone/menaquinone biosynthesis C-methylase UbiE